jgi:PAS domain S-box-containing protein
MLSNNITHTPTDLKKNKLHFSFLPAYCDYLLHNKLKEFSAEMLRVSKEEKVPFLKFLAAMPEDKLLELSIQTTKELLESLAENRASEFMDESVKRWKENRLPVIKEEQIVIEDISIFNFIRRKVFRDFFPLYSENVRIFVKVMEEVDRFSTAQEEISFKILLDLNQQKMQEEHYLIEKINNTSPGIIYVFDIKEKKEIYSNYKREQVLGYTTQEIKSMGNTVLNKLFHPIDLPRLEEHYKQFATALDGEIRSIEYKLGTKKGSYIWHRAYESVFKRDALGIPSQVIGITFDISKEKNYAKQLKIKEEQLLQAQEIAEIGNFEWDMTGKSSAYSNQTMQILELEEKKSFPEFIRYVHPSDQKKLKEALEKAMENGKYECEYRYRKNGEEKVIWSKGLVSFKDGKPTKMKGTVMNVTERHHMIKQLERSEELNKQAQALTHIGNWSWLLEDNHINWSDEMYRIYGLKPQSEKITQEYSLSFVHPDERKKREEETKIALETGTAHNSIVKIIAADGTHKVLDVKRELLLDADKKPYKMLGTAQDITQQYRLHQQLKENEEMFRQLINNAPDAVIVIDDHSKILLWNPKAEQIFGWNAEEMIGRSLVETIIPESFRDAHSMGIKRLRETGEEHMLNKTIEITAMNKKGQEFYIDLSISRSQREGKPVFISFIRDISKAKEIDIELEENRKELSLKNIELEKNNQELTSFNYIASHDLQEPLRKIRTYSNRIIEKHYDTLPDDAKEYFDRMINSAARMQKLIDDLLSFSRTTSAEKVFEYADLNILLEQAKNSIKHIMDDHQATVVSKCALPILKVIPFQFQQLLENIIGNAIKYSRPGVPPVITISCDTVSGKQYTLEGALKEKNYHQISIADNGIGFEQQYSRKIFELFQRLHGKNEYSGTGIGLAICKKIAENHHGFMTAHGKPGAGAVFNIFIPFEV